MRWQVPILRVMLLLGSLVTGAAAAPPPAKPAGPGSIAAPPADRQRPIEEARQLIVWQKYRAAERMLLDASQKVADSAAPDEQAALLTALGEVYVCSGKYESARTVLRRAIAACDRVAAPSHTLLAQQAAAAVLLSQAASALGDPAQAVVSLKTMWARFQSQRRVDPVAQLELLAQLSALDPADRSHGAPLVLAEEVRRLSERLGVDRRKGLIGTEDYARGLTSLADCQARSEDWRAGTEAMQKVVRLRADRHEILAEVAADRRLAEIYRQHADAKQEIQVLEQALQALARHDAVAGAAAADLQSRLLYERAELERLVAAAMLRSDRREDAIAQLLAAEQHYVAAQQASAAKLGGVDAGQLLERLADVSGRLLELGSRDPQRLPRTIDAHAQLLDQYRQTLLSDDPRVGSLEVILGSLYLKDGDSRHAGPLLQQALTYWRGRRPLDALRLAQTLHLLAENSLLIVPAPPAATIQNYLDEAYRLCLAHCPLDPLRWRTQLDRGRLYLATGQYRQAWVALEALVDPPAPLPLDIRSAALLQLGLLNKQLLRFDEAERLCRQGLEVRQHLPDVSDSELAPYYLALGSLQIARRDAAALAEIVERGAKLDLTGPQHNASRWELAHQQAMVHYLRNELAGDTHERQSAREMWEGLLADEADLPPALRARTLHFLARLDFLDWSSDVDAWQADFTSNAPQTESLSQLARQLADYERERRQYLADSAVYDNSAGAGGDPAERQRQFNALLERRGALEQKRLKLRQAHEGVVQQEQQRAQAASGVQAGWLDKLTHGLILADEAVALLTEQKVYPSLQFAALCNDAQLIEAQAQYVAQGREQRLQQALSRLEAAVALIEQPRASAVGDDVSRAEFFAQYRTAYDLLVQFHVEAHERLRDERHLVRALVAAERCRSRALLDQLHLATIANPDTAPAEPSQPSLAMLADLVGRRQLAEQPLLYYYVGAARSYLFVLGGSEKRLQAIRLRTASTAVESPAGTGAIDLHAYRLFASLSNEQTAAAIPTDSALRQRLAASSLVLLPTEAREYLEQEKARGANYALVVPHGAVAQIPLEALLIKESESLYLDDVAPPLAYAPSLVLLDRLSRLMSPAAPATHVLTLGNPDYQSQRPSSAPSNAQPTAKSAGDVVQRPAADQAEMVLEPLPASQQECDRILKLFGAALVTKLDGHSASEEHLRSALGAHRFALIHLAAHGVLRSGDLNPWLALSPPAAPDSSTQADGKLDGKLELGEIYALNLSGCELTVLSACNTNLDPRETARLRSQRAERGQQAPGMAPPALDTSFSIANAFLAAGSRRVVGTQWTVADDSTADLISRLFAKLYAQMATGREVNYARLLNEARSESRRSNPQWDTPFHWGPFVLIGPAESLPTASR